jgi:2',3'-cyclic-nucleotide 2'-phosphodiesterase (5'-nucleotidase family)
MRKGVKVDTEYYIEFQSCNKDCTKYNGTYIFISNKSYKYINIVDCIFKNIKNISQKNLVIMYKTTKLKFIFPSIKLDNPDVSITELTSGYVLK